MADKVKKPKTAAKPVKNTTKKETAKGTPLAVMPSREEIEKLARDHWAQRGFQDGFAEQDWFRAEQELRQKAS